MKKSQFTAAQIAFALKQSETGTRVEEVCRKMGISQATFFNWKKKYGGLGVSELRRLRQLEEENHQLKKLVADLSLDKQMLQEVIKKSFKGAVPQRAGRLVTGSVSCTCPQSLQNGIAWPFDVLLPAYAQGRPAIASAHPGDRPK